MILHTAIQSKEKVIKINRINNITVITFYIKTPQFFNIQKMKTLKLFFRESFVSFYLRITWRGKAYRVRLFKKYNKFTFNFGHSHWYKLIFNKKKIQFFKIKRQSYIVTYLHKYKYLLIRNLFNNIREYNKYTKRGIRLKKTTYKQRFGKISQVNSILHSF